MSADNPEFIYVCDTCLARFRNYPDLNVGSPCAKWGDPCPGRLRLPIPTPPAIEAQVVPITDSVLAPYLKSIAISLSAMTAYRTAELNCHDQPHVLQNLKLASDLAHDVDPDDG